MMAISASAPAQVAESGYTLPLKLAAEAAMMAVASCAGKGFPVTATVVDPEGQIRVQMKGDHSTIHTKDTAYRKAYTVVTLGPIFKFDRSSAFLRMLGEGPPTASAALSTVPDILLLPGGTAIKRGDEIVAAIGVAARQAATRTKPARWTELRRSWTESQNRVSNRVTWIRAAAARGDA